MQFQQLNKFKLILYPLFHKIYRQITKLIIIKTQSKESQNTITL